MASPPPAAESPHRYAGSKPYTRSKLENQAKERYPITSPVLQVVKLGKVRAEGADVGVELVSRKGCMKTLGCEVHEAQRTGAQQDTPVPWNQSWVSVVVSTGPSAEQSFSREKATAWLLWSSVYMDHFLL